MSEKLSVEVTGGTLIAEPSTDPEYPGIVISFQPDFDEFRAELALLEEADRKLVLRSWMDLTREDPDSYPCIYDKAMLFRIAYGIYTEQCSGMKKTPAEPEEFSEKYFSDIKCMEMLLPGNLFHVYKNIVA